MKKQRALAIGLVLLAAFLCFAYYAGSELKKTEAEGEKNMPLGSIPLLAISSAKCAGQGPDCANRLFQGCGINNRVQTPPTNDQIRRCIAANAPDEATGRKCTAFVDSAEAAAGKLGSTNEILLFLDNLDISTYGQTRGIWGAISVSGVKEAKAESMERLGECLDELGKFKPPQAP